MWRLAEVWPEREGPCDDRRRGVTQCYDDRHNTIALLCRFRILTGPPAIFRLEFMMRHGMSSSPPSVQAATENGGPWACWPGFRAQGRRLYPRLHRRQLRHGEGLAGRLRWLLG